MRSQNRGKPAQVTQVTEGDCVSQKESPIKPSGNKSQDELLKALEAIKVEVAEVKSKLKDMNQESEEGRPHQSVPNAKLIKKIDVLTAFFVVVKIIMQLDVDKIEETVL